MRRLLYRALTVSLATHDDPRRARDSKLLWGAEYVVGDPEALRFRLTPLGLINTVLRHAGLSLHLYPARGLRGGGRRS